MLRVLSTLFLLHCILFCSGVHASQVALSVCQGPFCAKYGCKNALLAAKLTGGIKAVPADCFGKQGCSTAFPQKGVRVKASGLGVRTLKGCENPFVAKANVEGIAKEFGL
jgi:hypothetical protein